MCDKHTVLKGAVHRSAGRSSSKGSGGFGLKTSVVDPDPAKSDRAFK